MESDPNPSFDFSSGDAFQLDFSAASASGEVWVLVQTDSHGGGPNEGYAMTQISGPGLVLVPFSSFANLQELDFGDVDSIRVRLHAEDASTAYSLASIKVVPEPSAALLLGVGIVGLVLARHHSRWRH
jgi:hypothetical protein